MASSSIITLLRSVRGLVIFAPLALLAISTARGESPPAAPVGPELSKDCQTPGVNISGEKPLPNVMRALTERKILKILMIGGSDSTRTKTTGTGYYALIEDILEKTIPGVDVQVIDRGVSGELANDAAARLQTEVALTSPDLVLWQLGTNDALARIPVEEFRSAVIDALDWLEKHNVDVVLVGVHYERHLKSDPHYQAIRQALKGIADERKVLHIGRYEATQFIEQAQAAATASLPNEFALTESGYACLAEYVVRAVTSSVYAKRSSKPSGG
jgi:lysophospholipase L1-like esterase